MRLSSLVVAGLCSALALVNLALAASPADAFVFSEPGTDAAGVVRLRPARTRIHVSALTRVSPREAVAFVPRDACPDPVAGAQPELSLSPCSEFEPPAPRYWREYREIAWAGVHFFPQYPAGASVTVVRNTMITQGRKTVVRASY